MAFLALSAASFLGGSYHGFRSHLGETGSAFVWKATLVSLGLVALFLFCSATVAAFPRRLRFALIGLGSISFGFYGTVIARKDDFLYAIIAYGASMAYVLGLQLYEVWMRRGSSSPWIVAGVLGSFLAAGVQQSGLSFAENFNENDLFHVLQMVNVYFLFRGGKRLTDRRD